MRYIGNKTKLLNEIDKMLIKKDIKKEGLVFCDAFCGSATVSNYFNCFYKIIANDLLDLSYNMASGNLMYKNNFFSNFDYDIFDYLNNYDASNYTKGFCFNNFSPNGNAMYFSDKNAKKIDFIRDTIDKWYEEKKINDYEKSYLVACLIEAVSKVSNVAGVYSAFLKIWDSRALKDIVITKLDTEESKYTNEVYCSDINELIKNIKGDILYLDPPYTTTQYNSQYHTLETICRNDFPETHGIGKHRENDRLSNWCKKGLVEYEFEKLIKEANFKHIIFSYSDKGIMSTKFIESVLKRYGEPDTFEFKKINFCKYKSTRAVNKENSNGTKDDIHYEYLFYIKKKEDVLYSSPLNYIGGKFDVLPLLKSNFKNKIDTFHDLFGGGATVSLNVCADKIVYNDINKFVVNLLKYLSTTHPYEVYKKIQKYTKKYNLSKGNKEAYFNLREDYNNKKEDILFYLLICYGFEHQIRFNNQLNFNNPCGNSGFNDEMYEKLISFYLRCQDINISFENKNYLEFNNCINEGDFVYLDPPYLGNNGVYQDGKRGFNGWDSEQELALHSFIENLNNNGISFMLSNYIEHTSNKENPLNDWSNSNNFKIIENDKVTKRNRQNRKEIIVINY